MRLGMNEVFNVTLHVPPLKKIEERTSILQSLDAFASEDLSFAVDALGANPISIKQLLMIVEMARQSGEGARSHISLDDWRLVLSDLTAVW